MSNKKLIMIHEDDLYFILQKQINEILTANSVLDNNKLSKLTIQQTDILINKIKNHGTGIR